MRRLDYQRREQLRLIEPSLHPYGPRGVIVLGGDAAEVVNRLYSRRRASDQRRERGVRVHSARQAWPRGGLRHVEHLAHVVQDADAAVVAHVLLDGFDDGDRLLPAPHRRSLPAPMLSRADARRVRYAVGYEQDVRGGMVGQLRRHPHVRLQRRWIRIRAQRGGVGAVECLLALALLPLRPRLLVELAFRREFPATAFFHHPVDILHARPAFLQGARHGLASRMRFAAHFACRRYGAHLRAHGQPAAALARCLTILF